MAKILNGPQKARRRIAIYGDPKTRKTNLATSYPSEGKILYIASDPDSVELGSVLDPDRIIQWIPEGKPDPYKELVDLVQTDHTKDGVDLIVWDTTTASARTLCNFYADTGVFSDKHVAIGKRGEAHFTANPQPGDFGIAQRSINDLLVGPTKGLFNMQRDCTIICVFHMDLSDKEGSPVYGPKTIGQAQIRDIGGIFGNLFHMEAAQSPVMGKPGVMETKFRVHMQTHGRYLAGVRATKALPPFELGDDPREFWKWFEEQTKR